MVIFRENTEDIYAGLEVEEGTPEAKRLIKLLKDEFGWDIRPDSGVGIKPISETGSKRLIRASIEYAVKRGRKSVTLVHKGNIQKFTEGAFRNWGYELVREEFADVAVGWDDCDGKPGDKILVKDAIADITLQQVLTRPDEFDVIATTNLNGDYLSDALAAQVGGIGIAPGGNINYVTGHGIFEATHGTAPKYAGQDKVNPGSLLLSGVLMFEHLGWQDAADDIVRGARGHHRRQDRHLRLRPPDGRRHRGQVLGVRPGHRRPPVGRPAGSAGNSPGGRHPAPSSATKQRQSRDPRRAQRPPHPPAHADPARGVGCELPADERRRRTAPRCSRAVVAENIDGLDDEQRELLPQLLFDARATGSSVPRIGLRYRLQTDVHGLDLSRHRLLEDDRACSSSSSTCTARRRPQVIGAVMAAAAMGSDRAAARRSARSRPAIAQPGVIPEPFVVRRLLHGVPIRRPPPPASGRSDRRRRRRRGTWVGRPVRAAVGDGGARPRCGHGASTAPTCRSGSAGCCGSRTPITAAAGGAAERIAELTEARTVLLDVLNAEAADPEESAG